MNITDIIQISDNNPLKDKDGNYIMCTDINFTKHMHYMLYIAMLKDYSVNPKNDIMLKLTARMLYEHLINKFKEKFPVESKECLEALSI